MADSIYYKTPFLLISIACQVCQICGDITPLGIK